MFKTIDSIMERDPAAKSRLQVMLTYNGYHAIVYHRINHFLYDHKWYLLASLGAFWAKHWTNIEIHTGAQIGQRLFIDHGMGVVIGETAIIGDDVTLHHGVTLGNRGPSSGLRRHPKLGNHVMIGAQAVVLGAITIGDAAQVGAGSVVVDDVPANATVVGEKAHILKHYKMQAVAKRVVEE